MKAANRRFCFVVGWVFLAIGLGTNGCGGDDTHAQDSSATHFLETCTADCAPGFDCLCGACTRQCVVASDCSALASRAVCTITAIAHPGCFNDPDLRACDVPCAADADCSSLPEASHCAAGYCREPSQVIESGAGGAANGGASSSSGGGGVANGGAPSSSGGSTTAGSSGGSPNGGSTSTDSGVGVDASSSQADASSGGTGNGVDAGETADANVLTVDPLGRWLDPGPGISCDYATNGSDTCNGPDINCNAAPINPACTQVENHFCCFDVGCLRNWTQDADYCPGPDIMINCDPSHGTPVGCTSPTTSPTIFCCTPAP